MAATKADAPSATSALNFDVINAWAEAHELSRGELAERLGIDRTTLWRWQEGLVVPTFEAVRDVAARLGLTVDEITATKGNPTPPPPTGPATPPPPSGPKAE